MHRRLIRIAAAVGIAVFGASALTACNPSDQEVACGALAGTWDGWTCIGGERTHTRRQGCALALQHIGYDPYWCWVI